MSICGSVYGGWLTVDPPSTATWWIEGTSIDRPNGSEKEADSAGSCVALKRRARVVAPWALIRFGHRGARMPGSPCDNLSEGTTVELLDQRPLEFGRTGAKRVWYAIEPTPGLVCYVRADGTRPEITPHNHAADIHPVYVPACYASSDDEDLLPEKLPPSIASEIRSIKAMRRSIMAGGPIEQWQFETVRARYRALLKTDASDPAVEEAIRVCLARVTRHEQAAEAARTIQTILAESHRRDREVAELERQLRSSAAGRFRSRAYQAVGFMQPSAQKVEGRKLFVLIGKNGATVAFLDIPPGLDPDPLLARRVGVRGVAHYHEELHSRLITVRDLETIESRR